MDLQKELLELLTRAKESGEYFNPHLLMGILDSISVTSGEEGLDEFYNWATKMFSR